MNFSQIDMNMSNDYYKWVEQLAARENRPVQSVKSSWLDKLCSLFR